VEKAYAALYAAAPAFWYKDASTKEFLSNEAAGQHWPSCGGNDDQADAIVHALPVVALLGGRNTSAMLAAADSVIRVSQNTDKGAAFGLAAARVLEYVIAYNMSGAALLTQVISDLRDPARASPYSEDSALADGLQNALDKLSQSNFDFVQATGQSCDYPFNLWTGAHLIAQLGSAPADFLSGGRQTILAGGDSGSRSFFVGAAQGARLGAASALPADWTAKTTAFAASAPLAHAIAAARGL
jgi:ADP-ribosylglycohydrolase